MGQKSLNRWQGIGFVGKDPEIRYTPKGAAVCNISLACTRTWKDSTGAKQERTDWIPVVAWDKLAELVGQYVHKGQLVMCEGTLQFRDAEKDGVKYSRGDIVLTDIIFLRSKEGFVAHQGQGRSAGPAPAAGQKRHTIYDPDGGPGVPDDDIPF
jgi:single-strand DNA-binding protein